MIRGFAAGLGLALAVTCFAASQEAAFVFPLQLSPDHTHLVDQTGAPFFIQGDAGWSILVQLTTAQAETYLDDRRAKGFDLIVVNLLEHKFSDQAPANRNHQPPFQPTGDFAAPVEGYFAHADSVIALAEARGMVVLLAPCYLGYDGGDEGWWREMNAAGEAKLRGYGRYLGNRYRDHKNILWLDAGDYSPPSANLVRAVAEGIREKDPVHLHAAHCKRNDSPRRVFAKETWLDLGTVYTGPLTYVGALADMREKPFKPAFLVESDFEREHNSTPASLRAEAYWAVLGGARLGHIFGAAPIWNFAPGWREALDSSGSTTIANVKPFFTQRAFYRLRPDTAHAVMTGGHFEFGSADFDIAAVTADTGCLLAYLPQGNHAVTVDLRRFPGRGRGVLCRWYNPRTGAYIVIGNFPASRPFAFSTPDGQDWALACETNPAEAARHRERSKR